MQNQKGGEETLWRGKLLWEQWLMGVSLDPAEQLQGTRNLEDGSKKRKRPRWRKNKGKIQGTNELLKPFQESLEQHCIEAEFIECCANPWGLLYPSCTVSKINTTSSKVTQTLCLQDRKKKLTTISKGFGSDVKTTRWIKNKYLEWRFGITQNFFPSVPMQMADILLCFMNGISNRNKWNRISDFKELAL